MTIMLSALFNLRSNTQTQALKSPIPNLNHSAVTQSRTETQRTELCPEHLHSNDALDLIKTAGQYRKNSLKESSVDLLN